MGGPTRKQLVERWEDSCTPEMLVAPSPFGLVDGREDFRGFHWSCPLDKWGFPKRVFSVSGQTVENVDLSYAEISPLTAREFTLTNSYAKRAKIFVSDWTYGSVTDCEFDRCAIKGSMPWRLVTVERCVFRACTFPKLFSFGARYEDCQAIDMRLNGPLGGSKDYPLLRNVTVSGKWKEFCVEEAVEGDQLVGCDFSGVEFEYFDFLYGDARKVKLPEGMQRFVVVNWGDVRDSIAEKLEALFESSSRGEQAHQQAMLALDLLEQDLKGRHDSVPRARGARYCDELKVAVDWGHSRNYLVEIYEDAGAEFMVDPRVDERYMDES